MDKEASNKKVLDEKERKVFVVSLPHDISTDDLHRYFARFGCIEEVRIIKDKEVGTMRGFGFILFQDRLGYIRVFEEGDFHVIKGKQVESFHPGRMQKSAHEGRATEYAEQTDEPALNFRPWPVRRPDDEQLLPPIYANAAADDATCAKLGHEQSQFRQAFSPAKPKHKKR
jgi:hypothetical protein